MTDVNPVIQVSNLVSALQKRAEIQGREPLYHFLESDGSQATLTARQLDQKARQIATWLQKQVASQKRVLLLYPPGLDYIMAFMGCLYSGAIAVPAYPPDPFRLAKTLPRLRNIIQDSQADFVLTTTPILEMSHFVFQEAPELKKLKWKATDLIETSAHQWEPFDPEPESLAFLQYTSGSTGSPKGVMLSHRNLLSNMKNIYRAFSLTPKTCAASWLPPYHDMGLIGGILTGVYGGYKMVLCSPMTFLQHPFLWLKMISDFRVDVSGGPNFAYELCLKKVTEEQKRQLDLSEWKAAFSGAEPIRAETLKRFSTAFACCGFQPENFYTCYGLAESTLIVSGTTRGVSPKVLSLSKAALREHQVLELAPTDPDSKQCVESGIPLETVWIVSPETQTICRENEIGEIWVSGPSVAQGYWNNRQKTAEIFEAKLHFEQNAGSHLATVTSVLGSKHEAQSIPKRFLRTGDLGFLKEGHLFVTGRIKDLILINGQNHYPEDLELSVERNNRLVRKGCVAAFSVDQEDLEKLVFVFEVDEREQTLLQDQDYETIFQSIREVISQEHELEIYEIVAIQKGTLPKTSSGKISRFACREAWMNQTLEILAHWIRKKTAGATVQSHALAQNRNLNQPSALNRHPVFIQAWLIEQLAILLDRRPDEISITEHFSNYGLDSKDAVNLSGDLEDWLKIKLSPTLIWEHPNIESLSKYLSQQRTYE